MDFSFSKPHYEKKKSLRKNGWRKFKEIQKVLHIESLSEVLFNLFFFALLKRFGSLLMKKKLGRKINAHEFLNILIKCFDFVDIFSGFLWWKCFLS